MSRRRDAETQSKFFQKKRRSLRLCASASRHANERSRDSRRRRADRRRRAGGTIGGAPARSVAERPPARRSSIAVLEKAREPGAHLLSGAVLDPRALAELIPDFEAKGAPLARRCATIASTSSPPSGKIKFPITPPPLRNHGNYIISVQQLGSWLSGLVEAEGVDMFSGFRRHRAADGRTARRRRANRRPRHRTPRRETRHVRAGRRYPREGHHPCRRRSRKSHEAADAALAASRSGNQPQLFALGIKELWDVPAGRLPGGTVMHTLGYPLDQKEFGGGFIYAMSETRLSVGFRRRASTTRIRVRSACRISAVQAASACQRAAAGRPDDSLWCEGAA